MIINMVNILCTSNSDSSKCRSYIIKNRKKVLKMLSIIKYYSNFFITVFLYKYDSKFSVREK